MVLHRDHPAEIWQLLPDLADHAEVVGALEAINQEKGLGVRLAQCVRQLVRPVRGIDRDEYRPDARRGHEKENPFGPVGRPHRYVIAPTDVQSHEGPGDDVNLVIVLGVRHPEALLLEDQGFAVRVARRGASQGGAYRQAIHRWDGKHDSSLLGVRRSLRRTIQIYRGPCREDVGVFPIEPWT
jgi:hypothetical protein